VSDDLRQSYGSTSQPTGFSTTGTGMASDAELICICPEPGPETIEVEQVLGAEMAQKVIEFDMDVPDPKPDIEQVIDVYVKDVEINSVDLIPNKVIIRGDLEVKVMYVADLPNKPVHAYERRHVRFTRDIVIEGAQKGMDAEADVTVEYVNYDFHRHHHKRRVHITIVLKFWARVMTTTQMDVYALGPVTEINQLEAANASALENTSVSASGVFGGDLNSTSQNAFDGFDHHTMMMGQGNMTVIGPGINQTAGTSMGISGTATITGSSVNIRTGPGTNFPIVTKINNGTTVTIKEQAFGWYKVVLADGSIGWVASWLVQTNGTPKG
jgi:hypothetical protein